MSHSAARESFRKEVQLRRASLLPHELGFLTNLLEDGTELELSSARVKLCEIVKEDGNDVGSTPAAAATAATAAATTTTTAGVEQPPLLCSSQSAPMATTATTSRDSLPPAMPPPSSPLTNRHASEGLGSGSVKRQQSLQYRRQSQVHGQIWKAHQNFGLAVTQKSSRRSVVMRQQELSTSNRLLALGGTSATVSAAPPAQQLIPPSLTASASSITGTTGSSRRRRASYFVPGTMPLTTSNSNAGNNRRELLSRHGSLSSFGRARSNSHMSLNSIGSMGDSCRSTARSDNHTEERRLSASLNLRYPPRGSISTGKQLPPFLMRRASSGVMSSAKYPLRRRTSSTSSTASTSCHATSKRDDDRPMATPQTNDTKILAPPPPFPARRKLSSTNSDLLGIPEEGDKTPSFDGSVTLKPSASDDIHKKGDEDNIVLDRDGSPTCHANQNIWDGTNLTEEDKKESEEEMTKTLFSPEKEEEADTIERLPVLIRRASVNNYGGEGMEVEEPGSLNFGEAKGNDGAANISRSDFTVENDDSTALSPNSDEKKDHSNDGSQQEQEQQQEQPRMIMRRASVNVYNGAGMEISDWDAQEDLEERREILDAYRQHHYMGAPSLTSFVNDKRTPGASPSSLAVLGRSNSFDERHSIDREDCLSFFDESPFTLYRSLSENELSSMLLLAHQSQHTFERVLSDRTVATTNYDEDGEEMSQADFEYDAWIDAPEEMGGILDLVPFRILGTSAEDVDSHPHVLSPPLMESIQAFFPFAHTSSNFWMKYSLVRDGASMHTLLQRARGAHFTILALETVDGEVFGAVTTEPWRTTWSYFGGGESFLWRMRHSRHTKCHSIIDQAHLESEIEVFPYTGENQCIQFCTSTNIAVGGGTAPEMLSPTKNGEDEAETQIREHEWGHGIYLDTDLMHGTSAPCITFGSPSLSEKHCDGSRFEIINLELWTMTPCYTLADAEKLELGKLFLEEHSFNADDYQSSDNLGANY